MRQKNSILNAVKLFYSFFILTMKLILSLLQDINLKVFSKYSNRGKSAEEIDYHDDESIYYLKPEPEETIAEIVKLNLQKRKKQERESKLIIINS